jgi:hypothetical protein
MEYAKGFAQTTKTVENWVADSEIKNLGGNKVETTNQLITVKDEVVTSIVGIDAEEREKIYRDIQVAQKEAFLEVDQDEFKEDSVNTKVYTEIQNIKKSGAFVPIEGLTPLYVDKNTGIKVLAKRIAEDGGLGNPVLVFVYADGSTSKDIEIKMSELLDIINGKHVNADNSDKADAKKAMKKIVGRISSNWDLSMGIRVADLITILIANFSTLQVDKENELDIDSVYEAIYSYIEKVHMDPDKPYMKRKTFYALKHEDMNEIALSLGVEVIDIAKTLKRNNVLRLQKKSRGYQCEVKDVGSCYCVRILAKDKHEDYVDFNYDPNERI